MGKNDLIGELEFYVASFINKPPTEEWKQVMEKKGHGQFKPAKGEIKLKISHISRIDAFFFFKT